VFSRGMSGAHNPTSMEPHVEKAKAEESKGEGANDIRDPLLHQDPCREVGGRSSTAQGGRSGDTGESLEDSTDDRPKSHIGPYRDVYAKGCNGKEEPCSDAQITLAENGKYSTDENWGIQQCFGYEEHWQAWLRHMAAYHKKEFKYEMQQILSGTDFTVVRYPGLVGERMTHLDQLPLRRGLKRKK
jgi:hypothetical protein